METPKTKETQAYEIIKEQLLRGDLPTNSFLSQRKLAQIANSNVVVIRAALKELEKDGLVEYVPKWGFRIPLETEETLCDRFFMRKLLETAAIERIFDQSLLGNSPNFDEDQIEKRNILLSLAKQCDCIDGDPSGKAADYTIAHYNLHRLLIETAQSPLLSTTFSRITLLGFFHLNTQAMWNTKPYRYQGRHEVFINALLSGTKTDAIATLNQHLDAGMENELEFLRLSSEK